MAAKSTSLYQHVREKGGRASCKEPCHSMATRSTEQGAKSKEHDARNEEHGARRASLHHIPPHRSSSTIMYLGSTMDATCRRVSWWVTHMDAVARYLHVDGFAGGS